MKFPQCVCYYTSLGFLSKGGLIVTDLELVVVVVFSTIVTWEVGVPWLLSILFNWSRDFILSCSSVLLNLLATLYELGFLGNSRPGSFSPRFGASLEKSISSLKWLNFLN